MRHIISIGVLQKMLGDGCERARVEEFSRANGGGALDGDAAEAKPAQVQATDERGARAARQEQARKVAQASRSRRRARPTRGTIPTIELCCFP